ncbi:hypothetical protein B0J15DRAFT_495039 [Fusarium solani]|uniref:Zn(2)-C6 fungal-type domain-containing protein n=1 Tax=Fusarium solani TaxID=169388 RepID=A0A9P9KF71_FUSSL|nr:uncharacterized protein B0J15DRAFT_495039 [Fusarium solani]KAH7254985.1 hypothetical protein B0J15DRAFT_495039 [Fusarium solani]
MAPSTALYSTPWIPAPYGRACVGCSRAKCKCFYRSNGGRCERCCRLEISCEPAAGVRKSRINAIRSASTADARLERRLDDLVSLIQSQGANRPTATPGTNDPPSVESSGQIPFDPPPEYSTPASPASSYQPDVAINSADATVELLRPVDPESSDPSSLILSDMPTHGLTDRVAEEQLNTFRRSFLPSSPLFHLPPSLSSREFRQQKPFTWFVAMTLSAKQISQQFAMEETIWRIISKRIVCEHLANLDLLIGLICFASWSHGFKMDKPFMTMLTQMAVSLAFELGLHKHPVNGAQRCKFGRSVAEQQQARRERTLEDRRTILALFHLSSSTWIAFRKTEPMRWTAYMQECLQILSEQGESHFDAILVAQIKCQLIFHQAEPFASAQPFLEGVQKTASATLITTLLRQLGEVRDTLPANIKSERIIQLYLCYAELALKKHLIGEPRTGSQSIPENFQRLQNLDSALGSTERWLGLLFDMPLSDLAGINVDFCTQFLHCLVILFKLTIHKEPGWDIEEVRKRIDVMSVLDRSHEVLGEVAMAMGIVDDPGPRMGLLFRTAGLFRAVKTLFMAEMQSRLPQNAPQEQVAEDLGGGMDGQGLNFSDELFQGLYEEPWLADLFDSTWQGDFDSV